MSAAYASEPKTADFKEGVKNLGDKYDDLKETASDLAKHAATTVRAGVGEMSAGVKRTVDSTKKTAADAAEGLTDHISENPMRSVVIALGVGAAIGYLLRGRRD